MSDQPQPPTKPTSLSDLTPSADGDFAASFNAHAAGWVAAMNVRFVRATIDEVTAEIEIGPQHHQGYGIVHGGVYSGLIETIASVGAALWARQAVASGGRLENPTSVFHAARRGR